MINATTSPVDTALLPILQQIEGIGTFGRIYGRLRVDKTKGVDKVGSVAKDRPRRLPLYWNADTRINTPIVPDEKLGGLCYVVTTGAATIVDGEPGWATLSQQQTKSYPLALLAWWDSTAQSLNRDMIQFMVELALGSCYSWQTTSVDDQLATRVFRDIDYDFDNHPYLMYPFAGLRIEGTLTITETVCNS